MFCGWRLANSFSELVRIGSGTLEMDCLTGVCRFNDSMVPSLSIAKELQAWLLHDLETNSIKSAQIDEASLQAVLGVATVSRRTRTTTTAYFGVDGKLMKSSTLVRCTIECVSRVRTGAYVYSTLKSSIEEFPADWPAA
ncbi:MAG TPA: hypothetical protein VF595_14495 [Tepidisphaeraceae bacterium]|jgi:hypothetical protein